MPRFVTIITLRCIYATLQKVGTTPWCPHYDVKCDGHHLYNYQKGVITPEHSNRCMIPGIPVVGLVSREGCRTPLHQENQIMRGCFCSPRAQSKDYPNVLRILRRRSDKNATYSATLSRTGNGPLSVRQHKRQERNPSNYYSWRFPSRQTHWQGLRRGETRFCHGNMAGR